MDFLSLVKMLIKMTELSLCMAMHFLSLLKVFIKATALPLYMTMDFLSLVKVGIAKSNSNINLYSAAYTIQTLSSGT